MKSSMAKHCKKRCVMRTALITKIITTSPVMLSLALPVATTLVLCAENLHNDNIVATHLDKFTTTMCIFLPIK